MRVNSIEKPLIGKYGAESENIVEHFTLGESGVSENIVAYARYDELSAVWERFDTDIEVLSSVVSENSKNIDYLSTYIDETISDEISANRENISTNINNIATLSSALGDSKSAGNLSGISYEEAIERPVYDQLKRIYNDMTIDQHNMHIVSGKVDFLHDTLVNKAAGLQSLEFEWLNGPDNHNKAGDNKAIETKVKRYFGNPNNNEEYQLDFQTQTIYNKDILDDVTFSWDGKEDGFKYGVSVGHLPTNSASIDDESDYVVHFVRIKCKDENATPERPWNISKQVIASYFADAKDINNSTNINNVNVWQLATPDLWTVDEDYSFGNRQDPYTLIAFIAKKHECELGETTDDIKDRCIDCYPMWKLYLVDNILKNVSSNGGNVSNKWTDIEEQTTTIPFETKSTDN
jgi:hypothetical protein